MTVVVVVQGFMNMSVVLGMMPTKGIPLPMISYGGSSLVSTLALSGNADECERARGMSMEHVFNAETREREIRGDESRDGSPRLLCVLRLAWMPDVHEGA